MGTSGPAIFSDDLACDIRSEFRELIGDGLSPKEATDKIIADYTKSGTPTDPDEGPTFWIALAATQWKCGRLLNSVQQRALASIKPDLLRWKHSAVGNAKAVAKSFAARAAVLENFRAQILSPPPKPTKISKVYHDRTTWQIGDLISYRLLSERFVVLRVIGIDNGMKHRTALCDMADWIGTTPPPVASLSKSPRMRTRHFDPANSFLMEHDGKLALYALSPKQFPADRLTLLGKTRQKKGIDIAGCSYFGGWSKFDAYLNEYFGLK